MKLPIYNQEGKELEAMEIDSPIFNSKLNKDLLHQVVVSQESNSRRVLADARDRAEVRGGGRKPWRQKGTGRARHGSIRSPLWKGGGVTHGPTSDRNFSKKINKKMASRALAMALSAKAKDGEVILLDQLKLASPKTKLAAGVISKLAGQKSLKNIIYKSVMMLLPNGSIAETKAFRNIKNVDIKLASAVIAREVIANTFVIIPKDAIAVLEKRVKSK
jgi:large subunit ribosomal protein L4